MSGTILGRQFGKDPLDDPIVTEWDAVVGDEPWFDPDWDDDRVVLLRQFHAFDDVPMPSPRFFDGLEQHLAGIALAQSAPDRHASGPDDSKSTSGRLTRIAPNPAGGSRAHRWMRLPAAAVVLALLALAGSLVLYRAIPSPSEAPPIPAAVFPNPELQPMMQFDFEPPLWGLPEATTWDNMSLGFYEIDPSTSLDTDNDWFTGVSGPFLIEVVSGELEIETRGPTVAYRAGTRREIEPGQTVWLGPNDGIVYSTTDTAVVTNPDPTPATALFGIAGMVDLDAPQGMLPTVLMDIDWHFIDSFPAIPTAGATVSIQRLTLLPYDSYILDPKDLLYLPAFRWGYYRGLSKAYGAIDGWSPDVKTTRVAESNGLRFLENGPITLFNLGEETIDIYFFVVEPYPNPATPTP
jgi:hypothetical protein